MAFDCEPITVLTEEQRERIATNKAAALARLAKARSLAAWATKPSHFDTNEGSQKSALLEPASGPVSLSSKLLVLVQKENHVTGQNAQRGPHLQPDTGVTGHCQVASIERGCSAPKVAKLTAEEGRIAGSPTTSCGVGVVLSRPDPKEFRKSWLSSAALLRDSVGGSSSARVQSVGTAPAAARVRKHTSKSPGKAVQSSLLLKETHAVPSVVDTKPGNRPLSPGGFERRAPIVSHLNRPAEATAQVVASNSVGLSERESDGAISFEKNGRFSPKGAAKAALDAFANAGSAARNSSPLETFANVQRGILRAEKGGLTAETGLLTGDRPPTNQKWGLPERNPVALKLCNGVKRGPSKTEGPFSVTTGAEGVSGAREEKGLLEQSGNVTETCSKSGTELAEGSFAGRAVGAVTGAEKKGPWLQWPKQDFDYFLVIDFECTCDNVSCFAPAEIIEFPSVLLNAKTLRIEDSFRVFCRPEAHPTLTPFCTQLTGIRQDQVDSGVSLREALSSHDTWLRSKNLLDKPNRFAVVTWTDWDCQTMLEMECKWKRIQKPAYFNRWINLKLPFAKVFPKAKGTCHGLKGHVTYAGVKWEGRQHSGLDDATNTARLAAALIRQGGKLTITGSFQIYAADGSKIERVMRKRPLVQADSNAREGPVANGQGGRCHCGVKRKRRTVKKPGPTHGQTFFSCGKWTITGGGCCEYFEWVQDGGGSEVGGQKRDGLRNGR